MNETLIIRNWDPDPKRQKLTYDTTDEIGKILRVHLEMERHLNAVLKELAPDVSPRNFTVKCQILSAIQAPAGLVELLEKFNSLRNALAHKIEANLQNNSTLVQRILDLGHEGYSKLDDVVVTFVNADTKEEVSFPFAEMSTANRLVAIGQISTSILAALPQTKKFLPPITIVKTSNVNW